MTAAGTGEKARPSLAGRPDLWFGIRLTDWAALLVAVGVALVGLAWFAGPSSALLLLGVLVGCIVLCAVVTRPPAALALLCVTEFTNAADVLAVPGLYLGAVGLGFASAMLALRDPIVRARVVRPALLPVLLVTAYLVATLPAVLGSEDPAGTAEWLGDLASNLAMFAVVLLLGLVVGRPWLLAAAIVLSLSAVGATTIVNQLALGAQPSTFGGFANISASLGEKITTPRHSGPMEDPNFWGRNLVLGLPLAYALVHRAASAGQRLAQSGWAVSVALLLGSIYLTQSRGTLLAALVATAVWVIGSGPRIRWQALLRLPLLLLPLLLPGVGDRLLDLESIFGDAPSYTLDPSLVERSAVQEVAHVVFVQNPLFGTGPSSFDTVVSDYAPRAGNLLIGRTTAPHNLYLELGAESGVVGLLGWLVLVGGFAVLAVQAVLRLAGARPDGRLGLPTRSLGAAVLAAVLAWSVASTFLHLEYFRALLIVFVLVVVVHDRGSRWASGGERSNAAETTARRALRVALVGGTVCALAAVAVGSAVLAASAETRYRSEVAFTLLPAPGTWAGYAIDIRDRVTVLPSYGAMLQADVPRTDVRVDAEPAKGVILMTAYGSTADEASARLRQAVAAAPGRLAEYRAERQYRLSQLGPPSTYVTNRYSAPAVALAGGAAVLAATGAYLALRRRDEQRWRQTE
jgi:hypothetical protein